MAAITGSSDALTGFNAGPAEQTQRDLLSCCAAEGWAREVTAGRPYPDLAALLRHADAALRRLAWTGVAQALAAHPRIGERPSGDDRESAWSRREQAGAGDTGAAMAAVNRAYEQRFGHLFLIFASGRSEAEILAAARERLGNDDETERRVVQEELRRIALLRLERLVRR